MDGDPPVETSGAANREARQHGSEEAGSEAWLVSEEAARQQAAARQPGWSISTTRGRPPSQQGQPASSGLARPQRIRRRNGWWDGIVGSGSVAGCLVAAPERVRQGISFGGEYDDRGWWVLDGWRQAAGLAHNRTATGNTTPTTTAPHKCPTWGIDQPNRTMHPHPRSLALNMVPKGDPRDRGLKNSVYP